MKFLTRLIQFFLLLIPLGIFFWLTRIELIPDGTFIVLHNPHQSSPYVDALAPQDRVRAPEKQNGTWVQALISDPVYFFLHPHRHFDHVTFEIWFQNSQIPLIEFGGLVQTKPDVYDLLPLHFLAIEKLGWTWIEENGLRLYQNPKSRPYVSLNDFYQNPPSQDRVAVYKADFSVPFRLHDYKASSHQQTVDVTLRGKHEFKTYIKNETLDFVFGYMDMNRDEGSDPIVATLFNEKNQPIMDVRADDDGDTRGDGIASAQQELRMRVTDLPEGVYKIVLSTGRDIFFRTIQTPQKKIVFLHSIFLGDEIGFHEQPQPTRFWSAANQLRMQTRHGEGLQEVTIGETSVSISQPYEFYTAQTNGKVQSVDVPKNDLEIFFDGPLAFARDAYFEPDPVVFTQSADVDYLLTSYQSPRVVDGWLVQKVELDTNKLIFEKKSWKFTFSMPEIRASGGEVLVKQINTIWTRKPFVWEDLWEALRVY